jgi:hypothetical protein
MICPMIGDFRRDPILPPIECAVCDPSLQTASAGHLVWPRNWPSHPQGDESGSGDT